MFISICAGVAVAAATFSGLKVGDKKRQQRKIEKEFAEKYRKQLAEQKVAEQAAKPEAAAVAIDAIGAAAKAAAEAINIAAGGAAPAADEKKTEGGAPVVNVPVDVPEA